MSRTDESQLDWKIICDLKMDASLLIIQIAFSPIKNQNSHHKNNFIVIVARRIEVLETRLNRREFF